MPRQDLGSCWRPTWSQMGPRMLQKLAAGRRRAAVRSSWLQSLNAQVKHASALPRRASLQHTSTSLHSTSCRYAQAGGEK